MSTSSPIQRSAFSLSSFRVFPHLLQLRVLRFGLLHDGDVGVLPEGPIRVFATAAAPPSAPTQRIVDRIAGDRAKSPSSRIPNAYLAPDTRYQATSMLHSSVPSQRRV